MRTKNSIKNIITGILQQGVVLILGFISRKIFVSYLGVELLGINGLLSNILSMLGLVELGIGTAIYYSLYRPIAEEDYGQINAIMKLYSRVYKYIGAIVGILGIILIPLLKYIVNTDINMKYVNIVFIVFLVDSVISYFLAYRRNIFSADQKDYVLNKIGVIFSILTSVLQITIIIFTQNYILYLIIKILIVFIQNLIIYYLTNKYYPYLRNNKSEPLKPEIKYELIKNVKALIIMKMAVYCVTGTDNILISIFVGVTTVGIYSNYALLINTVNSLIQQIFSGIRASFGNFLIKKTTEQGHEIFEILYFVNFWISTLCATLLFVLINPFITIWLGKNMLLPIEVVAIIVFNFYFISMTNSIEIVRSAAGMYSPYPFFKYWAFIEGIINLIASVILVGILKYGIIGIFLGTTLSSFITVYVLPWNVYKYVFKMDSKKYYIKHFLYMISSLLIVSITYFITNIINLDNIILIFIIKAVCCLLIPNVILIITFKNNKEFTYLVNKFKIIDKIKKHMIRKE